MGRDTRALCTPTSSRLSRAKLQQHRLLYSNSQQQEFPLSSSSSLSSCRCRSSSSIRHPTTPTWLAMPPISLDILELLLSMLHRLHTLHRTQHIPTYTDRLHLEKLIFSYCKLTYRFSFV